MIMHPNQQKPKQKKRSINWTYKEKKLLENLISQRSHIIDLKDCSTNTNVAKRAAWQEILTCYNAVHPKRDMAQLLNQWRNMKARAKSKSQLNGDHTPMMGDASPPTESQEVIIPKEFTRSPSTSDQDSQSRSATPIETFWQLSPVQPTSPPKKRVTKDENDLRKTKKNDKSDCCGDHEHQIFLLMKEGKEQTLLHEKEEHEKRMNILSLEEEYWRRKIAKLDDT